MYICLLFHFKNLKTMKKHTINATTSIYLFPLHCRVSFNMAIKSLGKLGTVTVLNTFKSNLALQLVTPF